MAERREQIQKRLSIERQIPASSQKKEIVQEIVEIKRQSLIEDKKALHEEEIIMRAPTDNIFKASAIPEPIIKLKSARKDGPVDLRKAEFDKELQEKIKTSIKGIDEFEHKIDDVQRVMFETDTKIEYDSTVTEKSLKSLGHESKKVDILSDVLDDASKRTVSDNKLQENLSKKSDTITTVRFLQHEIEETNKVMRKSSSKDTSDDVIDPELAAKLTVQKDKIIDFVEVEREILSPVKCEIKKTISSDQIDAELSSKLSKQKEKAERIVEDESQTAIDQQKSDKVADDEYFKDFHTEKTLSSATSIDKPTGKITGPNAESSITQILTESQQILSENKLVQAQTSKLKENVSSTVRFLEQEIEDTNKFVESPKTEIEHLVDMKMERKSSRGPFISETDSDEFYKTIEEKITKKLSQDMSAMKDDIASACKFSIMYIFIILL